VQRILAIGLALGLGVFGVLVLTESFGDTGTRAVEAQQPSCSPAYPDVCIPPPPPDLDCPQIQFTNIRLASPANDPHNLDADNDGVGCESSGADGGAATATPARTSTPAAGGAGTPAARPTGTPAAGATPQISVPRTGDGGLK
jgi:hypothetical protein